MFIYNNGNVNTGTFLARAIVAAADEAIEANYQNPENLAFTLYLAEDGSVSDNPYAEWTEWTNSVALSLGRGESLIGDFLAASRFEGAVEIVQAHNLVADYNAFLADTF